MPWSKKKIVVFWVKVLTVGMERTGQIWEMQEVELLRLYNNESISKPLISMVII